MDATYNYFQVILLNRMTVTESFISPNHMQQATLKSAGTVVWICTKIFSTQLDFINSSQNYMNASQN